MDTRSISVATELFVAVAGSLIVAIILGIWAWTRNRFKPEVPDSAMRAAQQFIAEYRAAYSDGNAPNRLNRLNDAIRDLRGLVEQCSPAIPRFIRSDGPARQAAAIAFLQECPQGKYLTWLKDVIVRNPGHQLGYQAAVALHIAAQRLGGADRTTLKSCIEAALSTAVGEKKQGAAMELRLAASAIEAGAKTSPGG